MGTTQTPFKVLKGAITLEDGALKVDAVKLYRDAIGVPDHVKNPVASNMRLAEFRRFTTKIRGLTQGWKGPAVVFQSKHAITSEVTTAVSKMISAEALTPWEA